MKRSITKSMIYGYMLNEGVYDKLKKKKEDKSQIDSFDKIRKEIISYLNQTIIPKLLTKSYIKKLDNIFSNTDNEDYYQSKNIKPSDIVKARVGSNNTINFYFYSDIDGDYQDIGNKLDFFFDDICKAITKNFDVEVKKQSGVQEFNIEIIVNSKSTNESTIYGYMLNEGVFDKLKKKNEELRKKNKKENSELSIQERKKQYDLCIKIVKDVLSKYNNPKGITAGVGDNPDNLEDFINGGPYDNVIILEWDAWEGTNNKAKNKELYSPFRDLVYKVLNDIEKDIKANKDLTGRAIAENDWDEGTLFYETLK